MRAITKGQSMKSDTSSRRDFPPLDSSSLYDDEADRNKHMAYMTSIAAEKQKDIAEVTPFYERILSDLRGQAKVHDFLNIFVAKRVTEHLKSFE
jgi:hypothetical protein